jgi:hypothetical protein
MNPCEVTTIALNNLFSTRGKGDDSLGVYSKNLLGMNNDQCTVINFDEIGKEHFIPLIHCNPTNQLIGTVKSVGPTKILLIVPSLDNVNMERELQYANEFTAYQSTEIIRFIQKLEQFCGESDDQNFQSHNKQSGEDLNMVMIAYEELRKSLETKQILLSTSNLVSYVKFERVCDALITRQHQLAIDILEAKDLISLLQGKEEDVYCQIYLKTDATLTRQ